MKRGFIAVLLTLAMLFTLCACGGKTTEPDEGEPTVPQVEESAEPTPTPEPEEMAYAKEYDFKFVSAATTMSYGYPSRMYADGYVDPVFEDKVNSSSFYLVSVEPYPEDDNYIVYTFKGTHAVFVNFTASADSSEGEDKNAGSPFLNLVFVDGNTGYRIPQRYVEYTGDDYQEFNITVSTDGEEAAENEVTLQDVLDAQGFEWDGEELHVTLLYSGDSTVYANRTYDVGGGRFCLDFWGGVDDTYTLIAPAGYTGLCIGVDMSSPRSDNQEDNGEAVALELFEPEENSDYYFMRLDEMAAPRLIAADGVKECSSPKSVDADTEELATVVDMQAYAEYGLTYTSTYYNCGFYPYSAFYSADIPEETLTAYGIDNILIAYHDPLDSFDGQPGSTMRAILDTGVCKTPIVNMSTGLLIEVVAFDGAGNIVGRSGTVAPGEFITEFTLDEVPATAFDAMGCKGMRFEDTGTEPNIIESEACIGLYVYLYDLDGNMISVDPLGVQ